MDWRTILAVGLSVVLIIIGMYVLPSLFPSKQAAQATRVSTPAATATTPAAGQPLAIICLLCDTGRKPLLSSQ